MLTHMLDYKLLIELVGVARQLHTREREVCSIARQAYVKVVSVGRTAERESIEPIT
jgi:hypothetical protein